MEFIVTILIIGTLIFLYQSNVNKKATNGKLSSTQVIYINGCLGYQNGVDIKIKANIDTITIDDKYNIQINKIKGVKLSKTKQLVEQGKSVAKRAIVGTIVAGGVGTIVGGVSGIGTTKKTEEINILEIEYIDDDNIKQDISFSWRDFEDKSPALNCWASGLNKRI